MSMFVLRRRRFVSRLLGAYRGYRRLFGRWQSVKAAFLLEYFCWKNGIRAAHEIKAGGTD